MKSKVIDWFLRLVKGVFVGTGFILPGVSGGALAAIFGLYERIIRFVAHITKDFKKNILFFIPVVAGMLVSIVGLAWPLGFFLDNYKAPTMLFFVGCIIGTLPSLWKQAGLKGRKPRHIVIMAAVAAVGFVFLFFADGLFQANVPQNFFTWILAGVIIALGVLVPGLSPSNFLIYMGLYDPMVAGFKHFDMMILLPIGIGLLVCIIAFSKLMDQVFKKAYAGLFHVILGVVVASTVMIVPFDTNYLSMGGLVCLACCVAGAALGWFMSRLEDKYVPEKAESGKELAMPQNLTAQQIAEYVDMAGALARVRGNTAVYQKMLGLLLDSGEFTALEEALAAGDLPKAANVAHSIKGMTGNLSLHRLFNSSTALMQALRAGNPDDTLLAQFREDAENTRACVRVLLDQMG